MKRISINEFIKEFDEQGKNYYGFYDWFCSDNALKGRAKTLLPKLKFLLEQKIINGEATYVWFKNNCPCKGSLYDDMRFGTIADETYLGGVAPSVGYDSNKGSCEGWFLLNDGTIDLIEYPNWATFKQAIIDDECFRNQLQNHFYVV